MPDFVQWYPLGQGDILDRTRLDKVFSAYRPVAVVHFAARIGVGESVRMPVTYYEANVGGALAVIAATQRAGIRHLLYSSTCATCGQPVRLLMGEDRPQQPINPYGRSKLMVEQALFDLDRHAAFHSVILRYCNAAGADPLGHIGERHHPETPAPLLAIGAALGRRPPFEIFGDDYPTRGPTSLP